MHHRRHSIAFTLSTVQNNSYSDFVLTKSPELKTRSFIFIHHSCFAKRDDMMRSSSSYKKFKRNSKEEKGDVKLYLNVKYLNITILIKIVFCDSGYFVITYNLVLFFLTRLCKIITVEKILPNLIFVVNWSVALVIPIVLQMFYSVI